ncbi:MAG TPA: ATP-binding protein [Streptosporangiaceae bacterium]|nr:ATP-binding protein [Streptosporangiaceae bacterium]
MIIGALEATDVEIKMVLYLPRDAASVPVSRQVLDGCLATLGVTPDTRTDIALALSEACSNVIQHADPADEYEVLAMASNGRCVIEVINTAHRDAVGVRADGGLGGQPFTPPSGPPSPTAEHGRGLQIIDAVADNVRLTRNSSDGTTVHFEKELEWLPDAAGRHLFAAN